MPKVPTYDNFQVAENPNMGAFSGGQPSVVSSEMATLPGRMLQSAGDNMQRAGDAFSKIAIDIQKDINEAEVKRMDSELVQSASALLDDPNNGYLNLQGKAAIDQHEQTRKALEEKREALAAKLQNPMQRQMFQAVSDQRLATSLRQIDVHAGAQARQYNLTETAASIDIERNNAAINAESFSTPDGAFDVYKMAFDRKVLKLAQLKGFQKDINPENSFEGLSDATKDLMLSERTKLHAGSIDHLIATGKAKEADAYFNKFKNEMAEGTRDKALDVLNAGKVKELTAGLENASQAAASSWISWRDKDADGKPTGLFSTNKQKIVELADELAAASKFAPGSEAAKAIKTRALTSMHEDVVTQMLSLGQAKEASAYLKSHVTEIDTKVYGRMDDRVRVFDNAQTGMETADKIWSALGPKKANDPIKQFEMEAEARKMFPDDPQKVQSTINELRSRGQSWNAQDTEVNAGNTNKVMEAYKNGTSMDKIKRMPEYLALPGDKQNQIAEHVNDRNHMLWARSIEDKNRLQAQQERKTSGAYYSYSDPDVLSTMSRQQVQALLPTLGDRQTGALLSKWEQLQNREGKITAAMDKEQFNAIADEFQLKPYDSSKSTKDKERLGLAKSRIDEQLEINAKNNRGPMSKEEKGKMMRDIMARTVTIEGEWWGEEEVPAVTVRPEEIKRVRVPREDRVKITEALREMYKENPIPKYAPTEENIKKQYVEKRISRK
jgi:hypothetical protein